MLILLNVSSDEKVLPTTYGELRPPLGKHRLKVSLVCFCCIHVSWEAGTKVHKYFGIQRMYTNTLVKAKYDTLGSPVVN